MNENISHADKNRVKIFAIQEAKQLLAEIHNLVNETREYKNNHTSSFFMEVVRQNRLEITSRIQGELCYWFLAGAQDPSDIDLKTTAYEVAKTYPDLDLAQKRLLRQMTLSVTAAAPEYLFNYDNKITEGRNSFYYFGRNSFCDVKTSKQLKDYLDQVLEGFSTISSYAQTILDMGETFQCQREAEGLEKIFPDDPKVGEILTMAKTDDWNFQRAEEIARELIQKINDDEFFKEIYKKRFDPEISESEQKEIVRVIFESVSTYINNIFHLADRLIAGTSFDHVIAGTETVIETGGAVEQLDGAVVAVDAGQIKAKSARRKP